MELKTLTHFFNKRVYTVPDYQRGYSWKPEHVLDLLRDISYSMKLDNQHYMGTITLHKQKEPIKIGLNNYANYHIVDGQQRFTTMILILSYILTTLKKDKDMAADAEEKIGTYLKNRGSFIFRYLVDEVSNVYFRSTILEMQGASSQEENVYTRNLLGAKTTIKAYFENKQDKLLDYLNALEEKLLFNEYLVADSSEIGVVFETMNNRGIDLSSLEIVKNRLLYLTSKLPKDRGIEESDIQDLSADINQYWSHILKNLTLPTRVLKEDTFLSNHWIIYHGWSKSNQEKTEILKKEFTIEKLVEDPIAIKKKISNYIQSIAQTSLHWRYLNFPEETNAFKDVTDLRIKEQLKDAFIRLNRLSNSTVRPLLLAFFPLLDKQPEVVLDLCELAEIYSFRLFSMNKRRSDTGKNDIYRQCNWMHNDCRSQKTIEYAKHLLGWYIHFYGDKERFDLEIDELFKSTKKKGFYDWGGLNYLLFEYEEHLRRNQSIKIPYSVAQSKKSVEHILPQTPSNAYWKKQLKDKKGEDKKRMIHSLGNLVLVTPRKNSELSNSPYPEKKELYYKGSYSEVKLAKKNEEWGEIEIEDRNKNLLKFLDERWKLMDNFLELYPNPFNENKEEVKILDEIEEEAENELIEDN